MVNFVRLVLASAVCLSLLLIAPVEAQGRFSPVLQVGDDVVTRFQIDQRTRFLALLRAPGDPRDIAREQLINETIQRRAAADAGIELSDEELQAELSGFAARANLTAEQFITALAQNGVGVETFRDFVGAGVLWRNYVRATFADSARDAIPQAALERTLARSGTEGGTRVLLSEVVLPATTDETIAASMARAREISTVGGEEAFAAAARKYSIGPSSLRGGELNWLDTEALPDAARATIARLSPGQISGPVRLENAIAVFLLRNREVIPAGTPETLLIDYALFIAASPTQAATVQAQIDQCDDLYGVAQSLPENRLIRESRPRGGLPGDVRAQIATLDANESTIISRNGQPAVLMLCGRKPLGENTVDLEIIGNRLLNERLTATAVDHLTGLRADTLVIDLTQN